MSPPLTRRKTLALGSIAGIGALAGCRGVVDAPEADASDAGDHDERDGSLGVTYGKSRGPFPSDGETHSGWVHIVSDGESADLTFDVRLCRTLGDVEPELTHAIANEYVLRFAVTAEFESDSSGNTATDSAPCSSVTHLVGGANVPSDWETLTVAVNDVEIRSIERSGTMPELRPLPDPVRPR